MKRENIIGRLQYMGKVVEFKKYHYWANVTHCEGCAIAYITSSGKNCIGIEEDVKFDDVLTAIKMKFRSVNDLYEYRRTGIDLRDNY